MGGVQSSAHSLGDALWMHERQRQQGQREAAAATGGRYESQDGHQNCGSQDRRQLLKRTRSLAVISEDTTRSERGESSRHFCLGEADFEIPRRPQLIPRAKLIDRNSLKDRLSKSQQHLSDSYDHRFNDSRSYHSHSTCELYSIPPALSSLPDPPLYGQTSRADPDRLNILDWPRTPRRYRSHQDLDTVSGLVDIIEDDTWPIEKNHESSSIDCIYTQIKRKRNEHRSLDSILLEDDGELEYFDVLNLLPLSKVRLEIDDDSDARTSSSNHNRSSSTNFVNEKFENQISAGRRSRGFSSRAEKLPCKEVELYGRRIQEVESNDEEEEQERQEKYSENSSTEESGLSEYCVSNSNEITEPCDNKKPSSIGNFTDEEKCKNQPIIKGYPEIVEFHERRDDKSRDSWQSYSLLFPLETRNVNCETEEIRKEIHESSLTNVASSSFAAVDSDAKKVKIILESSSSNSSNSEAESREGVNEESTEESLVVTTLKEVARRSRVEEAEDYKSIWISDTEEPEEMSRRPQVLKVIDNDVTRKRGRSANVVEIDVVARETPVSKDRDISQTEFKLTKAEELRENLPEVNKNGREENKIGMELSNDDKTDVETVREFFEKKSNGTESTRNRRNEGRLERIVKETSNILGKACNAVRGSLGFEARSESSDLGLGSDCGSDTRRRSIDDGIDALDASQSSCEKICNDARSDEEIVNGEKTRKAQRTNLTRSRSCVDSMDCQDESGPEFDHVRYKIVKSRLFGKNIFGNAANKHDVTYDGLMDYLREYSFQELLLDNNVVIIEPVRAETVERKASSVGTNSSSSRRSNGSCKVGGTSENKKETTDSESSDGNDEKSKDNENSLKLPKQSSLRKHFFYHPIRVNKELIDEELPDPDTVRNVRRMFENTMRSKSASKQSSDVDCENRKSASMKDLRRIEERGLDNVNERNFEASIRSRCSSRAKDLTRLFEALDKSAPNQTQTQSSKTENPGSPRSETKTRILAQSFEARSGNTSPSDAGSARNNNKSSRCRNSSNHHRRQRRSNWDAGSVSSGVSSDYPDTDPGSGAPCTSSEDEEIDYESSRESDRVSGQFVSQDVLKKIRECGTSVTYYGGKVVNTCNGPLISPMSCKLAKRSERALDGDEDYVKFRLVKSNSCDSRLELTGRVIERRSRLEAREAKNSARREKSSDLREATIAETPSIEITTAMDSSRIEIEDKMVQQLSLEKDGGKREPPVVIGLEPKREESRENSNGFKTDFKLGKIDENRAGYVNRFGSALTKWQINESNWKKTNADFGKMEFEEFEVLEDSLNGNEN